MVYLMATRDVECIGPNIKKGTCFEARKKPGYAGWHTFRACYHLGGTTYIATYEAVEITNAQFCKEIDHKHLKKEAV